MHWTSSFRDAVRIEVGRPTDGLPSEAAGSIHKTAAVCAACDFQSRIPHLLKVPSGSDACNSLNQWSCQPGLFISPWDRLPACRLEKTGKMPVPLSLFVNHPG
jgi:hypothetical protein